MLATNPLLPPALVKRESQFGSRVFAISTANELEILTKVRDYIRLNENYNEYMLLKSSTTSAGIGRLARVGLQSSAASDEASTISKTFRTLHWAFPQRSSPTGVLPQQLPKAASQ